MSLLPSNFKASEHEPNAGFEPVPAGSYIVMITASEMKDTNAGDGEYLKLTFKILDEGDYQGRYVWSNLNLINPNEKAVEIAQRELSAICHAIKVMDPKDSNELHGIPMKARIKVDPPSKDPKTGRQYDAQNSISFFKPMDAEDDNPAAGDFS